MSILDDIDKALSTGSKSAFTQESQPGAKVRGPIVSADYRQVIDFTTKLPATFPSGDRKMQLIVSIQTELGDGLDDDGIRSVYIPCWGKRKLSLIEAIQACGAAKASEVMVPGVIFEAEYLGEQRQTGGPSGSYTQKVYRYTFDRTGTAAAAIDQITQPPAAQGLGNQLAAQAARSGNTMPAPQPAAPAPAPTPAVDAPPPGMEAMWATLPPEAKAAILAAQ